MANRRGKNRSDVYDIDAGALALIDEAGSVVQVIPAEVCEAVRLMVARLRLSDGSDVPGRLGIISSLSGEGVTVITRALALMLSNDLGRRICIVELNFWSPSPWAEDRDAGGGIAEIIAAGASLDAVLVNTGSPGLSILPTGRTIVAERPLIANSPGLDAVLDELAQRFDHVLLDLPALDVTSDSLTLAEKAHNLVLVVHHGVTAEADVMSATERLAGSNVLGAIINAHASKLPAFVRRRLPPL